MALANRETAENVYSSDTDHTVLSAISKYKIETNKNNKIASKF